MDANTYLVKLTDLIHHAKITDKATMINFLENSAKMSIIECIYSTENIPTTIKEYRKCVIILDGGDKHIESLKKGFSRPTNSPTTSNRRDRTGTVFGGQGKPIDLNANQQGGNHHN